MDHLHILMLGDLLSLECLKYCTWTIFYHLQIKLNHRKLLDGMLEICGVPPEKFRTVCSSIDKLDKQTFEQIKKELVRNCFNCTISNREKKKRNRYCILCSYQINLIYSLC